MKGLNLRNKIVTCLVAIIAAVLCVSMSLNEKLVKKAYADSTMYTATTAEGNQKFSAKFDGDVLFSAEKVLMSAYAANNMLKPGAAADTKPRDYYKEEISGGNVFYQRTDTSDADGEERYFKDYYSDKGEDKKYVIDNGEFVMLENKYINDMYVNEAERDLSEVVLISFGQYIYGYDAINGLETITTADKTTSAGITNLSVEILKNGNKVTDLPPLRNVGLNLDFMYIIPQLEGNEGYYQFKFTYLINNSRYEATFEFYMIFETSYYGTVKFENSDNEYFIQPTLGWVESGNFAESASANGVTRYNVGQHGIHKSAELTVSYPTVTYDYSKYTFAYKHTANGIVTNYDFIYNHTTNLGVSNDTITYVVASGSFSDSTTKILNHENNERKLVTIVFTDPGLYEFTFDYIYDGNNAANAPDVNLDVKLIDSLYIHGADLVYSKYNYQSAEMRYLTISTNEKDKVDLIVPNAIAEDGSDGKNIANYKNSSIGFVYRTNNSSSSRVGNVVEDLSLNTLLNSELKNRDTITTDSHACDYDYLINTLDTDFYKNNADGYSDQLDTDIENFLDFDKISGTYTNSNSESLSSVLDSVNYQKTNQGSLWFTMNDTNEGSYYFYSQDKKIDVDKLFSKEMFDIAGTPTEKYKSNRIDINSETTFNKIGYYLVFLKIQPIGTKDGEPSGSVYSYYQIFAFEYSTSTVNITVREDTGLEDKTQEKVIGSNKFTTENVVASWVEPGVFERKLEARVYTTAVASDNINTIINKNNWKALVNDVTVIGKDIANGSYAKFLIEIKSEGESATYKVFTIDRENISGVKGYVVARKDAGSAYYYAYDIDDNGYTKVISNSITDSYATLNWNHKNSGANISVSYTWTRFVKTDVSTVNYASNKDWITTNYELGTTDGSYTLKEATNLSYLEDSSVISNQGIYIFTLTDEAGNSCKYVLVIDRTENFFYIDETNDDTANGLFYESGKSLLFSDKVTYDVGKYKAIKLEEKSGNEDLNNFLTSVKNNTLTDYGYYLGSGSNAASLRNIFVFDSSSNNHYLTVQNRELEAYNDRDEKISNLNTFSGVVNFSNDVKEISLIRKLYVKGENHIYSSTYNKYSNTNSKITLELNKDNAKGTVYYSSVSMENPPALGSTDKKLTAQGSVDITHATNAEYVTFSWIMGRDDYEVSEVYYQFYELKTSLQGLDERDVDTYFYGLLGDKVEIYKDGSFNTAIGAKKADDGIRGFM